MSYLRSLLFLAVSLVGAGFSFGQASITPDSPFRAKGNAGPTVPTQATSYELVGVISTTKQTLVGIVDKDSHRSFWIPVGKSVEGIEVVSCEPTQDRAVVKIKGDTRTLVMKSASTSTSPMPVVATSNVAPPSAPGQPRPNNPVVAEQEQEARMLVSDLLEIGIQQRKAYEETQRHAAAQKAAQQKR